MSPADRTERGQSKALAFEFELPHPPTKVWRALTDPDLLTRWLLPAVGFEAVPGRTFRFEAPPQPGWDGVVACRMLEVDEPRRIRWSWVVGDLDTVVTFTLEPTEAGTRLVLVQSGFRDDQKRNFGGARYGWRLMGGRLETLLSDIA